MNGLVSGIYKLCDALTPVALAVLVLMLVIAGISTMVDGMEAHGKLKSTVKFLIIGAAIAFTATILGKEIASWFMS